jgi:hypothetical protein
MYRCSVFVGGEGWLGMHDCREGRKDERRVKMKEQEDEQKG